MIKIHAYFKHNVYLALLYIIIISISSCASQQPQNLSLYNLLDDYGYSEDEQKKSLEYLMQEANIIPKTQTLKEHFSQRANYNELVKDILNFVKATQESFTVRSGTQERWHVKEATWMQQDKDKKIEALQKLELIDSVVPKIKNPYSICILGATYSSMKKRIDYAAKLYENNELNPKNIILLAGERYVTVGVDGNEIELLDIAKTYGLSDINKLTETHLIENLYKNSTLFNKLTYYIIDTPRGNLPRPTTETTIIELLNWLKIHEKIRSIVFISNQPSIKYQEAVIKEVIKDNIQWEVIGPAIKGDLKIHNIIGSLGSEIWAKTPSVIAKLNYKNLDKNLIKEFRQLYSKNPLIYKNIENLFEDK